METFPAQLLHILSLPRYGLSTLFVISFIAATLIPLTPTPFLMGLIKLNPELFWPAILIAGLGNTLGGAVDWWLGYGAKNIYDKMAKDHSYGKVMQWLQKFGSKTCLLSWLPVLGDPLSIAAGWLRLPFWPCIAYMFIGRTLRFLFVATILWSGYGPVHWHIKITEINYECDLLF